MAVTNMSLKLLIDTEGHKVPFVEADKEFIDFLFHILRFPLGTIIPLLKKQGTVGSFGNIYDSIENLSTTNLQPNVNKETLLNLKYKVNVLASMRKMVSFVDPPSATNTGSSGGGGYVKGLVTYMIMDDLEVKPMSTISSITLLNKLNVKHIGALEEKVVELGMDEL
ncbi:hypothetical protein SO802_016782 [Lithocarpus litseifolius]|uniref:Uncharacterized protein n=1 Tax=Lithocarpus litseifolius TaxID=425828 RepID=A0AAW2D165_9ROSI